MFKTVEKGNNTRALRVIACLTAVLLIMQTLPANVRATDHPTAVGMTDFAYKAMQEQWGYVYGTYGQMMTKTLVDGKAGQYGDVFAEVMSDGRTAYQHSLEWIGHRAADCIGLMKAYLWWHGDSIGPVYYSTQDKSANGLYASATVKGPISTIPETHGLILWRDGHVGIYVGNGWVIESRGCEYGVVRTRLTDRNWTSWFRHPSLDYGAIGWTVIGGETYYYRNGIYLTGLQMIDGQQYFLGIDGVRKTGFQTIAGILHYFGADGVQRTGWQTISGNTYYFGSDGAARTGWQQIDGTTCLFSAQGNLLSGWQETAEGLFFLDAQGSPLTGSQQVEGRQLIFSGDGHLLQGWQQISGSWRYLGLDGQARTGLQMIQGQSYWFDDSGNRGNGWQTAAGKAYYFSADDGRGLGGGLQTIDGLPLLLDPDGSLHTAAGLTFAAGHVFLSDDAGQAQSGQQTLTAWQAPDDAAGEPTAESIVLPFTADNALLDANQTDFSIEQASPTLILGGQANQAVSLTINGTAPAGAWYTLSPAVAAVTAEGLVTAAGPGRTVVLFRSASGEYSSCQITVLPDPAILDDSIAEKTLEPGSSAQFSLTGMDGGLLSACSFISSAPSVASVSPAGCVTAVAAGRATITLRYGDTAVVSWDILVGVPLVGLAAARTAIQIPIGGEATGLVRPVPASAGSAGITYESTNAEVAAVASDGTLRGLLAGSAVITARRGSASVACNVTVAGTYPTLSQGSNGDDVRRLQQHLLDLGYLTGPVDGYYGSQTEFAVSSFQKRLSLPLTGQANHALQLAASTGDALPASDLGASGRLQPGDHGEAVYALQQRLFELNVLKSMPDGEFGSLTLMAVKTLQVLNGLSQVDYADAALISRMNSRAVIAGLAKLHEGDSGYEVLQLQSRLKELNYYGGSLDATFNAALTLAVCGFQASAGLAADGVAGPITQRRIFAADAVMATGQPAGQQTLVSGSSGTAVLAVEQRLVALGYHYALANDVYDSLTVSSVKAFQRRAGLNQTGYADPNTQARLVSSTAPSSTATFRYGSSGDAVKRIQARLNQLGYACGTADGRFGSLTDRAARAFQRYSGLAADGIIGSRTLARLFYSTAASGAQTTPVVTPTTPTTPATPAEPAAGGTETLTSGSQGAGVLALEQRLVALGYHYALADSAYDSLTVSSVKAFQRRSGLSQTGVADPTTQTRLMATSALRSAASFRYGSSGDAVRRIQVRLNQLGFSCGTADGRFGSLTDRAVRAFQRKCGLTADGIAGSRTQARLFDVSAPTAG